MFRSILTYFFLLLLFSSCATIIRSADNDLDSGYYNYEMEAQAKKDSTIYKTEAEFKAYVDISEDTMHIYRANQKNELELVDSIPNLNLVPDQLQYSLGLSTFDLDILIIPVKLRPSQNGQPPRINANINAGIYTGYRYDKYYFLYQKTALQDYKKETFQSGFSIGGFVGLGASLIDPTVSQGAVDFEYEGIILTFGPAVLLDTKSLNFGANMGFDFLLDSNADQWVYQGKPYIGVVIGLNLN
jgi:hypothetical protein